MKLRGTPEELEEAKQWWAEQKERINKEYQEWLREKEERRKQKK